jgi:hypothetical protein
MVRWFTRFSMITSSLAAHNLTIAIAPALIIIWAVLGPGFRSRSTNGCTESRRACAQVESSCWSTSVSRRLASMYWSVGPAVDTETNVAKHFT